MMILPDEININVFSSCKFTNTSELHTHFQNLACISKRFSTYVEPVRWNYIEKLGIKKCLKFPSIQYLVSAQKKFRKLDLSEFSFKQDDLAKLVAVQTNLCTFYIQGDRLTNQVVDVLAPLKLLQKLKITKIPNGILGNDEVDQLLKNHPRLHRLTLETFKNQQGGFIEESASTPAMSTLVVETASPGPNNDFFSYFDHPGLIRRKAAAYYRIPNRQNLQFIRRSYIERNEIRSFLSGHPQLEILSFSGLLSTAIEDLFPKFKHLQSLSLFKAINSSDEIIEKIATLPYLVNLMIETSILAQGILEKIATMPKLQALSLGCCYLLEDVSFIAALTNLQRLKLYHCGNLKKGFGSVHKLEKIQQIILPTYLFENEIRELVGEDLLALKEKGIQVVEA